MEDLNNKLMEESFHPIKQADLFWAKDTIQQTVNLFNYNILVDDYVEDDIEYRIWYFIAKLFHSTSIRASS